MKLAEWAQVAEVVSGVAVLITLIFLAVGIRDNTKATQAAVYEDLLENLNQRNLLLVNDGELADLYLNRYSTNWDELDSQDQARLIFLNRALFRNYDAAYFAFRNGSLDTSQWRRFSEAICRQFANREQTPAVTELWQMTEDSVSDELAIFIDDNCTK